VADTEAEAEGEGEAEAEELLDSNATMDAIKASGGDERRNEVESGGDQGRCRRERKSE
jgi:hypothetical protein